MVNDYWLKQTNDHPLYPDLLWSRPQNKRMAGKLLIIGGNSSSFSEPSMAYASAQAAGVGNLRLMLPDKLELVLRHSLSDAIFATSTPSGSFSIKALAEFIDNANWSDGCLLAGNFGKNSETAIVLDRFCDKYLGVLALNGDAVDYFLNNPLKLLNRQSSCLFLELNQLQKIMNGAKFTKVITSQLSLFSVVELIRSFCLEYPHIGIVFNYQDQIILAQNYTVISSPRSEESMTALAAKATVWWLQNPHQLLPAMASSLIDTA